MFGLKIFVQVQTFLRGPHVPPHNFCHPASHKLVYSQVPQPLADRSQAVTLSDWCMTNTIDYPRQFFVPNFSTVQYQKISTYKLVNIRSSSGNHEVPWLWNHKPSEDHKKIRFTIKAAVSDPAHTQPIHPIPANDKYPKNCEIDTSTAPPPKKMIIPKLVYFDMVPVSGLRIDFLISN